MGTPFRSRTSVDDSVMNADLTVALDETELDELADLLAERSGEDGLQLDAAHGLMTAVAVGPKFIVPSEWLPQVLNQQHPFENEEAAERAVTLALRLFNMILRDLENMTFEALLGQVEAEDGDPEITARNWCIGFSMGVDLASDDWEGRMREDSHLMELLSPVITLAADEGLFNKDNEQTQTSLTAPEYEELVGRIGSAMIDVQQYWRDQPVIEGEGKPVDREQSESAEEGPRERPRKRGGHWLH